jgi:acyl-CoA synthetase (AMP-forming)/AMP-acid ligase II/thioesterase domain-containing protein
VAKRLHEYNNIYDIVTHWAINTPNSFSILAPKRDPLSYKQLAAQVKYIHNFLSGIGIKRNERVAVVLPNGPDLAVSFLGISSYATFAPLNPGYTKSEYEFYLTDLNANAIIINENNESDITQVAKNLGIKTIIVHSNLKAKAGVFTLSPESHSITKLNTYSDIDDIALILHTSGTTSRPKIVPLTHKNICSSTKNIHETLKLNQKDRCLNIMPLFHIHGLIGATLSTIYSGASIVCTPGFIGTKFIQWLDEFKPTWYTAVPTLHQMILQRAKANNITKTSLRFIRSSSSALPPKVMADLEKTFNVPVIESYGMTEASHQMTSNLLPPKKRKTGTVGVPAGPEITILDEQGNQQTQNSVGEIAVRGLNVMKGYENNPEANKIAFTDGWFRTGDEGYFDSDNYLIIKDRIKEIINRGGEKISPSEIDEVILDHPKVKQVVTFSVSHPVLGEEVGAAIVLNKDQEASQREIQEYVSQRLASFKVPRHIKFLKEIPKSDTGKIQRIGLAEQLEMTYTETQQVMQEFKKATTPTEKILTAIWREALGVEKIGVKDNFFQIGGDSLIAGQIISKIIETQKIDQLPLVIFLYAPTIEKMAEILENEKYEFPPASLVAIQPNGNKTPIYCVHSCRGDVLFLSHISQELGSEQPFYGLMAQGLDGKHPILKSVEEMSKHYLKEIKSYQPNPPYIFAGAGAGGFIALEMALTLNKETSQVEKVILFDMPFAMPMWSDDQSSRSVLINRLKRFQIKPAISSIRFWLNQYYSIIAERYVTRHKVHNNTWRAIQQYNLKTYSGDTILFVSEKHREPRYDVEYRIALWKNILTGNHNIHIIPGKHLEILKPPNVKILGDQLKKYL